MNRDEVLAAVNEAFRDGVKHLYDVLVQGLIAGQPPADLTARFNKGLATHCEARGHATATVEAYFRSNP